MKIKLQLLLIIMLSIICINCSFEVPDRLASAKFTDDKTIVYRWNLGIKDNYILRHVIVDNYSISFSEDSLLLADTTIKLAKSVDEGKTVTLVFKSSKGEEYNYSFIKDKSKGYPEVNE